MLPFETVSTFFIASLLLALSPGPDILFVIAQSIAWRAKAGILVALGLCTGLIVHTLAAALGVSLIIQSTPWAFIAIKVIGALYLLYLAWGAWHAPVSDQGVAASELSAAALYRRGIIMNLTNPKVSVFFLAFLPQFASPERGGIPLQMVSLGLIFMLAAIIVFSSVAIIAGRFGYWIGQSAKNQTRLNRTAAIVFIILAINVVWV